ncbi:MAG: hypothetical protein K0S79_1251 [Nitrospira sp.]|jgi:hypothetical protein|nr:hypothetical protein [Nitrospira sp.]
MPPTEFWISSSSNEAFRLAMVALAGLFLGLWSTMTGKGP